jgi:hypothetical protein
VNLFRDLKLELGIPVWLLCGVLGAWIATSKGRGGCFWFLLCAISGPFGLILAAVVSRKEKKRDD